MDGEHETSDTHESESLHVHAEASTLESAESHVARSPGSGEPGDASGSGFSPSFTALMEWGESKGLIRLECDFSFLSDPPDGYGDEHQAWFNEESSRWFKATYHNRFGLAWGRDGTATPREYLSRLVLQNRYFGDGIQLIALVNCAEKLRVLTSQPHIVGEPAIYEKTQAWLCALGFCRVELDSRIAWYWPEENLLVADAHEGNVIETATGELIPIDLNIIQPCGALRAWAISAC